MMIQQERIDHFLFTYPHVRRVLTGVEWRMFILMMEKSIMAKHTDFKSIFRKDTTNLSNTIAVHIRAMRAKFLKHKLPFEIITITGSGFAKGGYQIIRHD